MLGEGQGDESADGASGIGALAALLALAVLPFASLLGSPLFADDYIHIERALELGAGNARVLLDGWVLRADDAAAWWVPEGLRVQYFRPLVALSFWLDHRLWGLAPAGYHLTNLLIHAGVTLLVFGIARQLLRPVQAFAAAALFAVHPCHAEAVAWVSARTDSLMALLYTGAVLAEFERQRRGGSALLLALTSLLAFAALLAKEMAVTLPAILALNGLLHRRAEPGWWKGAAATGVVVALYFAGRILLLGGFEPPPHPFAHAPGDPDLPWNAVGGTLLYIANLILVAPVDPAEGFPLMTRFWPVLLGMAAVSGLVIAWLARLARVPGRSRPDAPHVVWLALLWFPITLSPVLPVSVGERFMYLPSIGLCLLVGAAVPPRWGGEPSARRRVALAGLVAVTLFTTGKIWIWRAFAELSRSAIDQTLAAVDAHPDARLVAVVDLPGTSALAFAHAVRLARPERGLEVELLSLAPHFVTPREDFGSEVKVEGDRLSIRAEDAPYLASYIEQAFRGGAGALRPGERIARPAFDVVIRDASEEGLRAFDVELRPETRGRRLLLRGERFELAPLAEP